MMWDGKNKLLRLEDVSALIAGDGLVEVMMPCGKILIVEDKELALRVIKYLNLPEYDHNGIVNSIHNAFGEEDGHDRQ